MVDAKPSRPLASEIRAHKRSQTACHGIRQILAPNGHHRPQHFPVHVIAIIHPLTHGRFDPENAAPMVKAILDALTDTGFWPDDDSKHIIGPDYRGGEPSIRKGWYRITIRIEEEEH